MDDNKDSNDDLSTISIVFIVIGVIVAILIVFFTILIVRQCLAKRNKKPARDSHNDEIGRTLGGFDSLHSPRHMQNSNRQATTSLTTFGQATPTAPEPDSDPEHGMPASNIGTYADSAYHASNNNRSNSGRYNDLNCNRQESHTSTSSTNNADGSSHTGYTSLGRGVPNTHNPYDSLKPKDGSKVEPSPPPPNLQNSPYSLAQAIEGNDNSDPNKMKTEISNIFSKKENTSAPTTKSEIPTQNTSKSSPVFTSSVDRTINDGDYDDQMDHTYDNRNGNRNTYFELEKLDDSEEQTFPSGNNTNLYFELEKING